VYEAMVVTVLTILHSGAQAVAALLSSYQGSIIL